MHISYCEKWIVGRNQAMNVINEDAARKRHEARQPYVALIGGAQQPRYIVDIADTWVSVIFMDSQLRQYLCYNFKEKQPGRLFLKSAYYWDYEGDSNSARSTKLFSFHENGHIDMEERNSVTGEVRELETTDSVDLNWESYPTFGNYAPLCNEERKPVNS